MVKIMIRKAEGTWVIRAGGAVLGESTEALELSQGEYLPVIYFPREDIAMAFLDATDHSSQCPYKGKASYYSIVTKSTTLKNAAWSYENASEEVARINGYVAFSPIDEVAVEQV